jgi:hypothetical protein
MGGWHVQTQTPIVLGGWANIKCISSVWCPAGMDSRVIVDKAFSSDWHNWFFVEVIKIVDLLVGRFVSWHEKQRRLSVSSTCCKNSSHSCRRQFLSAVVSPSIKCSLNVAMLRLLALTWWLWGGTR